ncbi:MAG TPA: arylamine N-acetyltransferase [Micropepsaceae bacterium]|nr:arylamine N-acetyltransferase [Micropepsaceae bacterium]
MDDIDLDAYFARISYSGGREPTLETLRAIHALHPAAIAFENLDPLLGRRVHLDSASIQHKLIASRRGGYCYELNGLLAGVLRTLGFRVTGLAARAIFGHAPGTTARTHMLLKVETEEGPHIADVGFGSRTLSAPLRLDHEGEQPTPHGVFRLIRDGMHVEEQTRIEGEWKSLYRFSLEEQTAKDYEVTNWFHSTNQGSPFTNRLMVSRFDGARRIGLFDNQFSIHHAEGTTDRRALQSAEDIAGMLETEFAIALPEPRDALLKMLTRMIA